MSISIFKADLANFQVDAEFGGCSVIISGSNHLIRVNGLVLAIKSDLISIINTKSLQRLLRATLHTVAYSNLVTLW